MFYFVYVCVCVCVCIFIVSISIHPSINEHLGYFQFLAFINNDVANIEVQISLFETVISFILDQYPEVGSLNHMVVLF